MVLWIFPDFHTPLQEEFLYWPENTVQLLNIYPSLCMRNLSDYVCTPLTSISPVNFGILSVMAHTVTMQRVVRPIFPQSKHAA